MKRNQFWDAGQYHASQWRPSWRELFSMLFFGRAWVVARGPATAVVGTRNWNGRGDSAKTLRARLGYPPLTAEAEEDNLAANSDGLYPPIPKPIPPPPPRERYPGCSIGDAVAIHGDVQIGAGTSICEPAELNGTKSWIHIGENCDIAAFVVLNVANSARRCIGLSNEIERAPIQLGCNVFVGSHCFIGGGVRIGHHSVVSAGTMLTKACEIPPYSLVLPAGAFSCSADGQWIGGAWVRAGYYEGECYYKGASAGEAGGME